MRPTQKGNPVGECWRDHCGTGVHIVYDGMWLSDGETCYYVYKDVHNMWAVARSVDSEPYNGLHNRVIATFADEDDAIMFAECTARRIARRVEEKVRAALAEYEETLWKNERRAAGI